MTTELARTFARAMNPTEEDLYKRFMSQQFWALGEFAALVNGLLPENYRNGSKGDSKMTDASFRRRSRGVVDVQLAFLDDLEKHPSKKQHCIFVDETLEMSAWRYIKWLAESQLSIHQRFLDELPLQLRELFREFLPINPALRTAPRHSKAYHKAYYLAQAEELLQIQPHLTPVQLYTHSHMQGVERYIRGLGGYYKRRTFLHAWLPSLNPRSKGRPLKNVN